MLAVKLLTNFANLSYKIQESISAHMSFIPEGWKYLTDSGKDSLSSVHNYRAVAFINEDSKEVLIANAGTDPLSRSDILDDIALKNGRLPYKFESAKYFLDNVINLLENPLEYTFAITGHSLGGVMSDLVACELASRGFKVESSYTFDNPGSKPVVENALKEGSLSEFEQSSIDFKAYNARPNLINTTNEQMGETHLVVFPQQRAKQTEDNSSATSYISYLFGKVGSAMSEAVSGLNPFKYSVGEIFNGAFSIYESYSKCYDPAFLTKQILKFTQLEPVYEELVKLGSDVASKVTNIASNSKVIFEVMDGAKEAAKIASVLYGVYTGTAIFNPTTMSALVTSGYKVKSLADKFYKLYSDTLALGEDVIKAANHIYRIPEHSLDNFKAAFEDSSHNVFLVEKGYSGSENIHITSEDIVVPEQISEQKSSGWFSSVLKWFNSKHDTIFVNGVKLSWGELVDLAFKCPLEKHDEMTQVECFSSEDADLSQEIQVVGLSDGNALPVEVAAG